MKKIILIGVIFFCIFGIGYGCLGHMKKVERIMHGTITSPKDLPYLFPKTAREIEQLVERTKKEATESVDRIIAVKDADRTFENTAGVLDYASGYQFAIPAEVLQTLVFVSPDDSVRQAAQKGFVELSQFSVDMFGQNVDLYKAFKAYAHGNAKNEQLNAEQKRFIDETMKDFKRAGLDLPEEKRARIKEIIKELSTLSTEFEKNIADSDEKIIVTKEELEGLEDDFIYNLEKTDDGKYILKTDYPIYFPIMEYSEVEETRKKMSKAFNRRGYPKNIEVLNRVIALRDELAQLLGFESYAALDIDEQMAKTPKTVQKFLDTLIEKAKVKHAQEFKKITADLAPSVKLTKDGKMKPWDGARAGAYYKKKHFNLDDREVAKYFPMEKTVKGLINIYEKFFNIKLNEVPISGMWHDDVTLIEMRNADDDQLRGYILLDMYPRPHKFTHACQIGIIPSLKKKDGSITPAVVTVLANLPKPTADKPSLLELSDVRTFFHEFGHAVHSLLASTELASFSGTRVKTDFVELPSQILEEWLWDRDILKNMSSHYQTGEPLPDTLLDTILELKNFNSGGWVMRQILYSFLSLNYFTAGGKKDTQAIMKKLTQELLPHREYDEDDRTQASFGHLMGYGSKYYGYLWSKVFALDLFDTIRKIGLLNPEIGTKYAKDILAPGGSTDPNDMLKNFLGRDPNSDAFFKDLGL